MLVLMNSYSANGAPINPVDEPVQGNIVTVHDGETLYTVAAENNAVQLDYIGVEGKLFAGWFADEACTVPADLRTLPKALMFMQSTFPIPISDFATIATDSSDSAA